jgi:Kyakuja-Dileera-Zisupton transposase
VQSIQWYDCLRAEIDARLDVALLDADRRIQASKAAEQDVRVRETEECARLLRQRCPACFAGNAFGRPFNEGGDIHVALDGNFHHRHQRNAGDSPHFFHPQYILSKRFVDDIGSHIQSVRGSQPKPYRSPVPDEAIDDCQRTYEAADGRKQKTSAEHFDDTGVMALVCRHDIPL